MLSNAKARTILIVVGVIVFIGIAVIIKNVFSEEENIAQKNSSVASIPKNLKNVPGGEVTEQYRKLQQTENKTRAEAAKKSGKSSIPTIIGNKHRQKQVANLLEKKEKPKRDFAAEADERARKRIEEQRAGIERLNKQRQKEERNKVALRQKQVSEKNHSQQLKTIIQNMDGYRKELFGVWNRQPSQEHVEGKLAAADSSNFADDENVYNQKYGVKVTSASSGSEEGAKASKSSKGSSEIIKAGTIMFGVLRTGINSDEESPVLADIVQGKYKGGKLIGTITRNENAEKVIINFTKLTLPTRDTSLEVAIVAIDPNTARTALASEVDHHYLMRYGSLFASSFLEGLGEAVGSLGKITTTVTDPSSGKVTQTSQKSGNNNTLSSKEIVMTSAGKVGQKWGEQVAPGFSRPPTITVDSGTSLGLLFTNDVDVNV